ncbi:MAG: MFS transporter [Chloroflexi bacterium]|nr:MFS transporter [Chloroflexota bacterium]
MEQKQRNRILLILFLGVLMGALDIAIVGPALPSIRASFGIDERAASWIFTTYVLFNLIGVPLMAKLSDVFGRRTIYVLDVSLFACGSIIVALSQGLPVMLLGRAVQGLGAGGVFPVASAVIGDTFPPEKRGGALGMIGAVFGLAFLVGPLLAGVILSFTSWHWLFSLNVPIAAVVILSAMRVLPATRPAQQKTFDWQGMIVLALLLAGLVVGINRLDTKNIAGSFLAFDTLPFFVATFALVPLFIWLEQRAANPVVHLELFHSRQVVVAGALAAGAGLSEATIVFVPQFVVFAFGVTGSVASFMLLPAVLAMAGGAPLAGRLLDRYGSRVVVLLGASLSTVGLFIVALFGTNVVFFYVSALFAGTGLGVLLGAPLRYIMLNEAPAAERAAAQGILTLHSSIGQLVGGALVGAIAASTGSGAVGLTSAFLVVGAIMLVLTALTILLKSRHAELDTARRNQPARAGDKWQVMGEK